MTWLFTMWMTSVLAISGTVPALVCQVVDGDRILGKDLAAANPAFATLDPAMVIGPAPLAGVRRVFYAQESVRLARQNGIALSAPFGELCFERATELLTAEKLLPVLRGVIGIEAAEIEILDFSRYAVPLGTLEFTRAGLSTGGLWRGHIAYTRGRSAAIWAKVRVTSEQTWVEAGESLTAGKILDGRQLVIRTGPRFPFGAAPLDSVERIAGQKPTRMIRAGEPIFASMLTKPHEVERGDPVAVEVSSGDAKLGFDATAESSGRLGESVLIRNPVSGQRFQARVEGKGKVSVKK